MKKIKVNFWCLVYFLAARMVVWVIHHMKPGRERIDLLSKLSEMNSRIATHNDTPTWLRMKILFISIDVIKIVREDTEYWNKKNEYIKNLSKELES